VPDNNELGKVEDWMNNVEDRFYKVDEIDKQLIEISIFNARASTSSAQQSKKSKEKGSKQKVGKRSKTDLKYKIGDIVWIRPRKYQCPWPAYIKGINNWKEAHMLIVPYTLEMKPVYTSYNIYSHKIVQKFEIDCIEMEEEGKAYYDKKPEWDTTKYVNWKHAVYMCEECLRAEEGGMLKKPSEKLHYFLSTGLDYHVAQAVKEFSKDGKLPPPVETATSTTTSEVVENEETKPTEDMLEATKNPSQLTPLVKSKRSISRRIRSSPSTGRPFKLKKGKPVLTSKDEVVEESATSKSSLSPMREDDLSSNNLIFNSELDEEYELEEPVQQKEPTLEELMAHLNEEKKVEYRLAERLVREFDEKNEELIVYIRSGKCDQHIMDIYEGNVDCKRMKSFNERWGGDGPNIATDRPVAKATYYDSHEHGSKIVKHILQLTGTFPEFTPVPGEIYSCKSRRKEFELIYDVFQMEATIKSIRDCWGKSASEAEEIFAKGYQGPAKYVNELERELPRDEINKLVERKYRTLFRF